MKYIYLVFSWLFGLIFLLATLGAVSESLWGALCMLAMSSLLLPPVRNFVHAKLQLSMPSKVRAVSLFLLFIAFGFFIGQSADRKAAELAAQQAREEEELAAQVRQANIQYFNEHRDEVVSSVQTAISNEEYQSAISLASKYLVSGDSELSQLSNRAQSIISEREAADRAERERVENEAKTKEILATLSTVPESEYQRNLALYRQLVTMNPGNSNYSERADYYSSRVQEQVEAERVERERVENESRLRIEKFGNPPTASAWDGSYLPVEQYLEAVARDPDSVEIDGCTKVYHIEEGWLVGCNWRGRNGFGGMNRESNWFTIVHNRVVEMHDGDRYNP